MIRVAVNGALGQMGQVTVAAVQAHHAMDLVGAWDKADCLSSVLSREQPDVMIDFTLPHCVFDNAQLAIEYGVRPVIGATGLTNEEVTVLQAQCAAKGLGGLIAPNFSISAILMMQLSQQAGRFMPNVEIIEMHHPNKVDAPSGTAKATAALIAGSDVNQVPIHSVRLPMTIKIYRRHWAHAPLKMTFTSVALMPQLAI